MKFATVSYGEKKHLRIRLFGKEEISEEAHWGRGIREVYILHYIVKGKGYFNGKPVRSGEGFFIEPGKSHEYHTSNSAPWSYLWVTLDGEDVKEICQNHIHINSEGIFEFEFQTELLELYDRIFSERVEMSESRALSYFYYLLSLHGDDMEKDPSTGYVKEAKRYMRSNFHRQISIIEVAEAVGIDDRYLYNLFVASEGISPKRYLTELKMRRARSMLKNTDSKISEIAISVGFPDVLTFSRFFSKNEGVSPKKYRENA